MTAPRQIELGKLVELRRSDADAILDFFDPAPAVVRGQHSKAAAKSISAEQPRYYSEYCSFIEQWFVDAAMRDRFKDYTPALRAVIGNLIARAEVFVAEQGDDATHVVGSDKLVPVLTEEKLTRLLQSLPNPKDPSITPPYRLAVIGVLCAGVIRAFDNSLLMVQWGPVLDLPPLPNSAHSRLELYAVARSDPGFVTDTVAAQQAEISKLTETISSFEPIIRHIDAQIGNLNSRYENNTAKTDALSDRIDQTHIEIDDFKNATIERLRLNTAKELWKKVYTENRTAFRYSASAIIVMLLGAAAGLYSFSDPVLSYLSGIRSVAVGSSETTDITVELDRVATTTDLLARFVVISVPLGLYIWLIKLLVRFNTRSMLLADDARFRVTMLDTYFYLIEKDGAVREDRGAILEALFRRAPGHGNDNVEAPHFTDLLNYGRAQGQGSTRQ